MTPEECKQMSYARATPEERARMIMLEDESLRLRGALAQLDSDRAALNKVNEGWDALEARVAALDREIEKCKQLIGLRVALGR